MAKNTTEEKKQVGKRPLLIALVILLLAAAVWGVSAKYIYQNESKGLAHASEFYFTSDTLTAAGDKVYPLKSSTTSLSFYLRNYDGAQVSDIEIDYTITITVEPAAAVTIEPASGTLEAGGELDQKIVLSGLKKGTKYTVTATGKNGYSETLSATFDIKDDTGVYKNTRFFGDYVLLTVWAEGVAGTVSITVPAGLIPDATDPALVELYKDGIYDGTSFSYSLGVGQSKAFRFFTDSDPGEMMVTEGGVLLGETILD